MKKLSFHYTVSNAQKFFNVFIFQLLLLNVTSAQNEKKFESILVSDGLAQSAVMDICQDQYGYVWFGTRGGLSRYDGYGFVNYIRDKEDSLSLSHSTIWSLFNSEKGELWIGTGNGLNKLNRVSENFTQYLHPDLEGNNIQQIFPWSSDTLLLCTQKGIFFFDTFNKKFFRNPSLTEFDRLSIKDVTRRPDRSLVFASEVGIHLFSEGQITKELLLGDMLIIYTDRTGQVWASNQKQTYLISSDFSNSRLVSTDDYRENLGEILEDKNGNIILAKGQIKVFNPRGELVETYEHDANKENSLLYNRVSCMEIDKSGIWWIGVNGYGANKYDPNKPIIDILKHNAREDLSLSANYVTSFFTKDDKTIYIGNSGGIDIFNKSQNTIENIFASNIDYLYANAGTLWAASNDTLLAVDISKKAIKKKYLIPGLKRIKDIRMDGDNLLIANYLGLIKLDPVTGAYDVDLPLQSSIKRPSQDWITAIFQDSKKTILGTSVGIYEMDDSGQIEKSKDPLFAPLSNTYIKCIVEDKKGIIWIGSWGEGLFRWDREANSLKQFTRKDGLPDDVVYGVLEDDNGFLWMSTNLGLSRLDESQQKFFNLDMSYGLQSNEFNTSAFFKSPNSIFYFGGIEGLNYFNPINIENSKIPETHITGFYLNNKRTTPLQIGLSQSIMDAKTIELSYDQNMLGFDFWGSNMTISKLNQFAYYMENLEEDWNYVGDRRFANYSALEPGEYVFNVKSSNNNGVWDNTPARLMIIIKPPFWGTWWFKTLIFLVIAVSVIWIFRWRTNSLKENHRRLELKIEEATSEIKQQNAELSEQKDHLQLAISDTNYVIREAVESGNFRARIDLSSKDGEWKELGLLINQLFDSVTQPFNLMNEMVNAMSKGDLSMRYTGEAKGDVQELTSNLNTALDELSGVLNTIALQVSSIGSSSAEMLNTSQEMSTISTEIASAIAEMSSGAQSQVSKVDESSSLVEGIKKFSVEMGQQAEKINNAAEIGVSRSQNGTSLVGQVDVSMKNILTISEKTNLAFVSLTKRSEEITRVLNIIKEIASQTNLLALNAAIEAAQAGDAGRGFAVVAEEIRKLAEGSKESTKEIERLIMGVQTDTKNTAELISEMSESIRVGEEASSETSTAFDEIAEACAQTLQLSKKIVEVTKLQTVDIANIVGITENIVVIAEQTAAGTEEVATSASELSSGMTNYTNRSRQVSDIVNDLGEKVSKFKLE